MADLTESGVTVTTSETPVVFYSTETMGVPGKAATIAVGTTVTTAPGTSALVTNVGDTTTATFNFGIPQGSNAASTTTSSFVVPLVGGTASVTLADASWVTIGQMMYFAGAAGSGLAGDMQVIGRTGNTVTLKNLSGSAGAAPGSGDMFRAVYDPDSDGIVSHAALADAVPWTGVTAKPLSTVSGPGLLATVSGASSDYIGGDNAPHPLTNLLPVGTIIEYAGASAPTGWLICNGASLSRTTYSALFAVVGTTYGAVDGASFSLPDFRGRTAVGVGLGAGLTNRTLGTAGGEENHVMSAAEMLSHTHPMSHTHGMGNHTHLGANHLHDLQNHVHYVDHYHNINASGFHAHGLGGHIHSAGLQVGNEIALHNAGGTCYGSNGITGQNTGGPSGGSDGANFAATNTVYASQTNGAWQYSGGPNINNTGYSDRDLTTAGPSTNTTDASSLANTGATGGSAGHNTMMPYLCVNRLIKY